MKPFTLIACFIVTLSVSACDTDKVEVLKSPCASAAEDGPCGAKRPVNAWWLKSAG